MNNFFFFLALLLSTCTAPVSKWTDCLEPCRNSRNENTIMSFNHFFLTHLDFLTDYVIGTQWKSGNDPMYDHGRRLCRALLTMSSFIVMVIICQVLNVYCGIILRTSLALEFTWCEGIYQCSQGKQWSPLFHCSYVAGKRKCNAWQASSTCRR